MSNQKKCEGACARHGGHEGPVTLVRVSDQRTDRVWGVFWYCRAAQEMDVDNGFQVDAVNEEPQP